MRDEHGGQVGRIARLAGTVREAVGAAHSGRDAVIGRAMREGRRSGTGTIAPDGEAVAPAGVGTSRGGVLGSGIALIVDSGCDVPPGIAARYGIQVVPLQITYPDGSTYADGVDITPAQVYARMPQKIPTTSLPGADRILEALETARAQGCTRVVGVTISSALSGTFDLMRRLIADAPDLDGFVVDSRSIGLGAAMSAIAVARAIEDGVPFGQLEAHILACRSRTQVLFTVSTLDYLIRGGRIGRAKGLAGTLLGVRPVFTCDGGGAFCVVQQLRGTKKALARMADIVAEQVARYPRVLVAVADAAAPELSEEAERLLRERLAPGAIVGDEILRGEISAALGVHAGPGLVGMCYLGLPA